MTQPSTRMNMTGLNQQWWDSALAAIGKNPDPLNQTEAAFYQSMLSATIECEASGFQFRPTIKQFNWLRQIAEAVK